MGESTITLLYKSGEEADIKNYRPISLLNTDWKILKLFINAPFNIRRLLSPNPLIQSLPDPLSLSLASRSIWIFRKEEYQKLNIIYPWMTHWYLPSIILDLPQSHLRSETIFSKKKKSD